MLFWLLLFAFLGLSRAIPEPLVRRYTNDTTAGSSNGTSDGLYSSPGVYPGIQGGRTEDDEWKDAYTKARDFVKNLNLAEKVNLTTGTGWMQDQCVGNTGDLPRHDMRGLCFQDGPLGIRYADLSVAHPAGITVGATWNKTLMYSRGHALGSQHKKKGVDVMLGPAVGPIGVKAQGGRIWEAFGADPYLQGVAGAETVKGIQDNGVIANGKHYLMNEQELDRNTVSSNVNDRALREIYSWPFADMIHAGLGSVMCSYNLINNSYSCENSKLLNGVLKDEMGFNGFVVSDWEATRSGIGSAIGGMDCNMPGGGLSIPVGTSHWGWNMTVSVMNGSLPIDRVDDMATRIMAAYYKVGLDKVRKERNGESVNFSSWTKSDKGPQYPMFKEGAIVTVNKHVPANDKTYRDVGYQVAVEAVTLLKNNNKTLPLDENKLPKRLAILGLAAAPSPQGAICGDDAGCSDGALAEGWGSGAATMSSFISPYEEINRRATNGGASVQHSFDQSATDKLVDQASASDMNLIFALTDSGEEFIAVDGNVGDRKNTTLWHGGDEIIQAALNVSSNNVVVVSSVGPVNLEKFINHPNCSAVLFTPPGAESAGPAIADVIFGKHNPSGRLPFTIAKDDKDYLPLANKSSPNGFPQDNEMAKADLYVDYRHFDHNKIEPRFEFGYGLSYSNFTFTNLVLQPVSPPDEHLPDPKPLADPFDFGSKIPEAKDMLFPSTWNRITGFLYPYLNSTSDVSKNSTQYPYPDGYSKDQPKKSSPAGGYSGGNKRLWDIAYRAVVQLTNQGPYEGEYVAQLYIGFPKSDKYPTPPRQLRGFDKINLAKGQPGQLQLDILVRHLTVWDVELQNWVVPRGTYTVYVGSSSRNLELKQTFKL